MSTADIFVAFASSACIRIADNHVIFSNHDHYLAICRKHRLSRSQGWDSSPKLWWTIWLELSGLRPLPSLNILTSKLLIALLFSFWPRTYVGICTSVTSRILLTLLPPHRYYHFQRLQCTYNGYDTLSNTLSSPFSSRRPYSSHCPKTAPLQVESGVIRFILRVLCLTSTMRKWQVAHVIEVTIHSYESCGLLASEYTGWMDIWHFLFLCSHMWHLFVPGGAFPARCYIPPFLNASPSALLC